MIGRNILANVVGGSWSILLTLVIIPIQLSVLGVDAFGLLAFIASLQALSASLDLGLSPTIAREVAMDNSSDLQHSRELLQTFSAGYAGIGFLLGGVVIIGSDWLVGHWLHLGDLAPDAASAALKFGGLAITLRWPISFFTGVLTGRRRFDILNLLRVSVSTIGLLGGALVIFVFADLVIFTAWTALAALMEVTAFLVASRRLVPGLSLRPRVSRRALARVRRFTVDMSVFRLLGIALRQSDFIMLSVLAPIETLGYYALAYRVLSGMTTLQNFVTSALFPSFAANYERGAMVRLVSDYNRATQGLIFVCTWPIVLLMFFGYPILRIWTSPETATAAVPILVLLAPGFLLGMSMAIPTTLATASGNTGIVVRRNLVGLGLYLPLLYVAITGWGGIGAAAVWFIINLTYLFTLLPMVQRLIVGQSTRAWLERNLMPFVVIGVLTLGAGRGVLAITGWQSVIAGVITCALAGAVYGLWGLRLLDPDLRQKIWTLVRRPKALLRRAQ